MTRKSPKDPAFNKVLRAEIEGTSPNERMIFIDTENRVREAVYPSEFHTGTLQRVRKRLTDEGVLKAVVHVSARVLGAPGGHGSRTSYVEYLPEGAWYLTTFQPPLLDWAAVDQDAARKDFDKLFGNGEGEEPPEEPAEQ